ncbi:hypothetical protein [Amphibacillus jilinensis]|uniref:hypothetical protein n=1 Tax=Amphibacillus jilinensis TaxID=1216008 RepID=UPI0002E77A55|nr:hypothetical protein [Amphibacillus jilinensis]
MKEDTFFFRDKYTIKEMVRRIYSEQFIEHFKSYAINKELNKESCYRGLLKRFRDNSNGLRNEIESCFEKYGRQGDRLNVKLYVLKKFEYKYSEEIEERLKDLQTHKRNIRLIDSISPGLKDDTYITKVKFDRNKLDLKITIEQAVINQDEEIPVEVIDEISIETRLYFNSGIIAVYNPKGNESHVKNIIKVIYLIIKGHTPDYYPVILDEAQLIMCNLRLNGDVSSPKFSSGEDLKIDMYGIHAGNTENPIVKFVGDSQLEIYELSTRSIIQGHNCSMKINNNGKVQIETYVTSDVLDVIVLHLTWIIFSEKYYKDYNAQLNLYLKQMYKASLGVHRDRKVGEIKSQLEGLIKENTNKEFKMKELKLLVTIIYNLSTMIAESDSVYSLSPELTSDHSLKVGECDTIKDFLSKYMVLNKNKNKSESDELSNLILSFLKSLIYDSNGDGVIIIEKYEEWLKCQNTVFQ